MRMRSPQADMLLYAALCCSPWKVIRLMIPNIFDGLIETTHPCVFFFPSSSVGETRIRWKCKRCDANGFSKDGMHQHELSGVVPVVPPFASSPQ